MEGVPQGPLSWEFCHLSRKPDLSFTRMTAWIFFFFNPLSLITKGRLGRGFISDQNLILSLELLFLLRPTPVCAPRWMVLRDRKVWSAASVEWWKIQALGTNSGVWLTQCEKDSFPCFQFCAVFRSHAHWWRWGVEIHEISRSWVHMDHGWDGCSRNKEGKVAFCYIPPALVSFSSEWPVPTYAFVSSCRRTPPGWPHW